MWSWFRPTDHHLLAVRVKQARLAFSYPHVNCTASVAPPPGYTADHNRVQLGVGREAYRVACDALRKWMQFPDGWVTIDPPVAPIQSGTVVTVTAKAFGVWWVNACRIVSVIHEPNRFGFAYGTLPGHVEMGEERFTIEHRDDGSVWYEILAHSRPRYWLTRLAYLLTRRMQRRFARDSMAGMVRAVQATVNTVSLPIPA